MNNNKEMEMSKNKAVAGSSSCSETEGEDWCFVCKDGGDLRVCDHPQCQKAYHADCAGKDGSFLDSKERWHCDWHYCLDECEIPSDVHCYTCPKSACQRCLPHPDLLKVKGKYGFCDECLELVLLIEEGKDCTSDGEKVDFKDINSYEGLFWDYYHELIKIKHGIRLGEINVALSKSKKNKKNKENKIHSAKAPKKNKEIPGPDKDDVACVKKRKIQKISQEQMSPIENAYVLKEDVAECASGKDSAEPDKDVAWDKKRKIEKTSQKKTSPVENAEDVAEYASGNERAELDKDDVAFVKKQEIEKTSQKEMLPIANADVRKEDVAECASGKDSAEPDKEDVACYKKCKIEKTSQKLTSPMENADVRKEDVAECSSGKDSAKIPSSWKRQKGGDVDENHGHEEDIVCTKGQEDDKIDDEPPSGDPNKENWWVSGPLNKFPSSLGFLTQLKYDVPNPSAFKVWKDEQNEEKAISLTHPSLKKKFDKITDETPSWDLNKEKWWVSHFYKCRASLRYLKDLHDDEPNPSAFKVWKDNQSEEKAISLTHPSLTKKFDKITDETPSGDRSKEKWWVSDPNFNKCRASLRYLKKLHDGEPNPSAFKVWKDNQNEENAISLTHPSLKKKFDSLYL